MKIALCGQSINCLLIPKCWYLTMSQCKLILLRRQKNLNQGLFMMLSRAFLRWLLKWKLDVEFCAFFLCLIFTWYCWIHLHLFIHTFTIGLSCYICLAKQWRWKISWRPFYISKENQYKVQIKVPFKPSSSSLVHEFLPLKLPTG